MSAEIFSEFVRDSKLDDILKVITDIKQSLRDSLSSSKTTITNLRIMKQ